MDHTVWSYLLPFTAALELGAAFDPLDVYLRYGWVGCCRKTAVWKQNFKKGKKKKEYKKGNGDRHKTSRTISPNGQYLPCYDSKETRDLHDNTS